jgi:branched-chain amino acid transport system ATP-binding protein
MTEEVLLKIEGLDVHYGDLQAVWGISLEVMKDRITSIIGANGAGKSTTLKTIAGLLPATNGRIEFLGRDIAPLKPFQTVAAGISMVPEGRRIFPRLTVEENLLIGAYTQRARKHLETAKQKIYNLFPILAERANQLGTNLSGGEQQMLAIGRALMSEPTLILFDEISLGLAPLIIKNIYDKVRDINREGITVVLVEQDIKRSLKASSHTFIFQEGHMVLSGYPAVLTEEEVKKAYFGL